jgi:hypothetical protein
MEKGQLLGKGSTAEVYGWGQDKIIKLFFNKYSSDYRVNYEANVSRIVYESGVISPAVYDTVEVDGRKGIIYERIKGKPIIEHLITAPWNSYYYLQKTIELQHNIHKFSAKELPTQEERFTHAIGLSSWILGDRAKKIIDYMKGLPDGESICHGDFYMNNILVSGKKLVPIDWAGAYQGNPLGDVARTGMIISSPALPYEIPDPVTMLSNYPKKLFFWHYINEYMRRSKARFADIDSWVLPVAAAKLKDNVPGEEKWLLDIINKRFEQINL